MKIGILTLPLHTNYGGILQAYALMTIIKRMGHEVVLISMNNSYYPLLWKKPFILAKYILKKYVLKKDVLPFNQRRIKLIKDREIMMEEHITPFINKYIQPQTKLCTVKNVKSICDEYDFDIYIVGSDQVWNGALSNLTTFFFDFVSDNKKRISYAASFASQSWIYSNKLTKKCKNLISKFSYISVREDVGVFFCEDKFNINATHVLDPTFLLSVSEYNSIINNYISIKNTSTRNGIMTYILDESDDKDTSVNIISDFYSLPIFSIHNQNISNKELPAEDRVQPAVELWLQGFKEADFIITDSFHACVFSIIYKKNFIVYGNEKRGMARFYSLLSLFGLENRLVKHSTEITANLLKESIQWENVHKKLREEQKKSMNFLIKALS
ncbi:MAG: polysaccharide pyruvyl transferase family protein [bacterium]